MKRLPASRARTEPSPPSVALAGDGTTVAFWSLATNMVPEADTNGVNDIFVRDLTR